jgi:TonB family protein
MDATLNNGNLLDVIASLTSGRESGRLQIKVSGSAGAFFFKNGKLVDAHMGPFSGFPAVNYAVSLGQATLNFDSSIEPPAQTSTAIATNERVLLKERFGIEAIDIDSVCEDQDSEIDDANLPISIVTQPLVSEGRPTLGNRPRAFSHNPSIQDDIRRSARARESRRRTARSCKAGGRKKQPRGANEPGNEATEPTRKSIEPREGVGRRDQGLTAAITHQFLDEPAEENRSRVKEVDESDLPMSDRGDKETSESFDLNVTRDIQSTESKSDTRTWSTTEEQRLSQSSIPALTQVGLEANTGTNEGTIKRCPKCNRVYDDFRTYCRHDSTRLVSEIDTPGNPIVKPEHLTAPALVWALVITTLLASGFLGYRLNSYLSNRSKAISTPSRSASDALSNLDSDQPVIEGLLSGKEITLMKPDYPAEAKAKGVSGKVTVAIVVNKQGRVVSARALTGEPLLKSAAVAAARQSKFLPGNLKRSNSGTIAYTFRL